MYQIIHSSNLILKQFQTTLYILQQFYLVNQYLNSQDSIETSLLSEVSNNIVISQLHINIFEF